jgi:hypothetical protein
VSEVKKAMAILRKESSYENRKKYFAWEVALKISNLRVQCEEKILSENS